MCVQAWIAKTSIPTQAIIIGQPEKALCVWSFTGSTGGSGEAGSLICRVDRSARFLPFIG
jgi:hypothetical protein